MSTQNYQYKIYFKLITRIQFAKIPRKTLAQLNSYEFRALVGGKRKSLLFQIISD